jgi:hypothetical protein
VGWCLDAHVPTPDLDGAPIILWDCSATFSDERWQLNLGTPNWGVLASRAWNSTSHCLTDPGGQILPGLWTQLQTCKLAAPEMLRTFQVAA